MSPTRPRRAAVLPSMSATSRLVAVVAASLLFATSLLCNERGCFAASPDARCAYVWISFVGTRAIDLIACAAAAALIKAVRTLLFACYAAKLSLWQPFLLP